MKKKNHKQRNLLHPLIITINLVLLLIMGSALGIGQMGMAAEGDAVPEKEPPIEKVEGPKEEVNMITAQICLFELQKYADPEFEKYKTFMEENFKNKAATKDLVLIGVKRYEKFREDIKASLALQITQQLATAAASEASNAAQYPGIIDCQNKANEYMNEAAKMLQMRAVTTSSIKRASLFVEKYKQINGKLRSLDMDIMRMVSNITAFEQKLPCYLKSCVK